MNGRWFGVGVLLVLASGLPCAHAMAQLADEPIVTFDYPDTVYVCQTEDYPLEIRDGQPGYVYQWFFNGAPINGQV